ncbi:MAG: hypothetical protein ACRDV0_05075, partial [Acidimicrobiales bacterium]
RVDDRVVAEHDAVLAAFGLDPRPRVRYATDDLVAAMRDDKKSHHDLTFVLPGPRGFEVVADVDATGVGRELEHLWGVA